MERRTFLQVKSDTLRQVCKILHDNYHVNPNAIARATGLSPRYYADFLSGRRPKLLDKNLALIENYIFDLYDMILVEELEMNQITIPTKEEFEKEKVKAK